MTLIGEVPPGLAATAARIGDAATVLDEDQVTAFVQRAARARTRSTGAASACWCRTRTRTCPLPLLLRGRARRAARAGQPDDGAGRAGHARADERGGAGRPPRLPPGRLEPTYPGTTVVNHEWWKPETFADLGTIPASRIASCPRAGWTWTCRCCSTARSSSTTSRWSSARCCRTRSSGSPAATSTSSPASRGQDIIDISHWLGALITSAEIIGTTRDHAGARPDQRRRGAHPVGEARDLRRDGRGRGRRGRRRRGRHGHRTGRRAGCTRSRSATPARRGRRPPRSAPRPTSPTSTPRSAGCCRSSRRCTTTSGPGPRASTSWSRWSPTAAR